MQNSTTEPMDPSKQCCPHAACSARGQIAAGNIRIHSYQPQRYRCRTCHRTFSARRGTMMEGLRKEKALVMLMEKPSMVFPSDPGVIFPGADLILSYARMYKSSL